MMINYIPRLSVQKGINGMNVVLILSGCRGGGEGLRNHQVLDFPSLDDALASNLAQLIQILVIPWN
jgi:hypothetical protein